jgi:sigma-B regulation protein RsbU (phosphoserine phosphatase)
MNLLVVDDAPDNLMLLEAILESEGFNSITLASSAREAYQKLEEAKNDQAVDLILMDIMMPEISGIDAIREIRSREHYQDIPILVVSARSETNALVEAFEAGAVDYLTKPINELELIARIRSMLRLKSETDHRKFHERELEKLALELEMKNNELQQILDDLNDDLEAAGKMQRSLLPDPGILLSGFDYGWYFEPCKSIGGDLLNIVPINDDESLFFLLDVSGHGIQSAMLAVSVHRMLSAWGGQNSIIMEENGSLKSSEQVVAELNREFLIQKNNFQYFTMIYGRLSRNCFKYCRAGHTPVLIQRKDNSLEVKEEGNVPVGLTKENDWQEYSINLEPGDRIISYSDGLTEARVGNDFFGEKRFYDLIKESQSLHPKKAVEQIVNEIKSWLKYSPLLDDISLIILEVRD